MMLPPPTEMFPVHERARVTLTSQRYALAMEDVDELLDGYMRDHVGIGRLSRWGPPNTAFNALSSICHALSTPGHYSQAPDILGASASELAEVMEMVWSQHQWAEYLTYALGASAVLVESDGAGVAARVVPPHHLWATTKPGRPGEVQVMRHLQVREIRGELRYTWDVWDIRDPEAPTFRVMLAAGDGAMGEEVTGEVFPAGDLDALAAYPWRRPDGSPYMPWSIHRSWDVGDLWNWQRGRGVARGTLHVMMLWSAADRCALNATGKVTLVFGGTPLGVEQRRGPYPGETAMTLDVDPGDMVFIAPMEGGGQMSATEIGEVETLPALMEYVRMAAGQLATDIGITPSDSMAKSAGPESGEAISLRNATKRLEQRRRNPLCRVADLATLRHVCWLLGLDDAGLGVVYHEIPLSPEEEREARTSMEWERTQGMVSSVDLLMMRRPGMQREQAVAELRRVRAEERALSADGGDAGAAPLAGVTQAALDVVGRVSAGQIPRESGVEWLVRYGGLDPEAAESLMGSAGLTFEPAVPAE